MHYPVNFDPLQVENMATFRAHMFYSIGILNILIIGQMTTIDGKLTGKLAG